MHLNVPSIYFVYVFVCRMLSPHLRVEEMDHRCLHFLCCSFVSFGILCLRVRAYSCYTSCPLVCCACLPSVRCCKHYVCSVYVGGYGGLSERGLCVFPELCPVSFLIVGESRSLLL